jgi:hypothetical protein
MVLVNPTLYQSGRKFACKVLTTKSRELDTYTYILVKIAYVSGWPELYVYAVYDRIFRDFPAKSTAFILYIYGSGQPDTYCTMRVKALLEAVHNRWGSSHDPESTHTQSRIDTHTIQS